MQETAWEAEDVCRSVSVQEAEEFLKTTKACARKLALSVSACILSPALLILLGVLAEEKRIGITEAMAGGVGTAALLLIVAAAVADFILVGWKLDKYEYMEKENITLDDGIYDGVLVEKESFRPAVQWSVAIGVALCIVSVIPLLIPGRL